MMFGKKVILLTASIMAVSLWGCSSGFDAENSQTSTTTVDASVVGAGNCIGCHQTASLSTAGSPQIVTDYLAGKHVVHNTTDIDATSAAACLTCHDPIGDGRSLENFITSYPLAGLAAVTCEACHGAGGDHPISAASITVPYKKPDYDRCGQCHSAAITQNSFHPAEGDNIVENYKASKHFSGQVRNSAVCVKCHTDEGAQLYKTIVSGTGDLTTTASTATASKIQCRTCHNPHNNNLLLKAADANGSAEYNTCTNCHQRHDATIGASITQVGSSSDGASGQLIFHAGSWDRVISSTHWDDPATSYQAALAAAGGVSRNVVQANVIVEGYTMNPLNERVCRDCHNVHGADATINKQWAASGHGGKIRTLKETAAGIAATPIAQITAVRSAGANGGDNALPHYDWDDTGGWSGSARGSCQKCHTSTGAKNYLSDPANYAYASNDFSHLSGWVNGVSSSGQNELIYCWACHSDNSGTLRNPGAVTMEYMLSATESIVLPDIGKSNLCATCHGGRGNYYSMTQSRYAYGFQGHNAPSAGTLYSASTHIGYEYPGKSYADKSYFRHSRIGTDVTGASDAGNFSGAIAITGTSSGPCVSCHMTAKSHTFNAVEKTGTTVTTINNQALCNTCHSTHGLMTPAKVEEDSLGYQNASTLLNAYVANTITNYQGIAITSSTTLVDDYGAFQNGKIAAADPGGFAHNSIYVKRLIFDSIDWLDNGVLNGTITIPLATTTYLQAYNWLGEIRP